MRCTSCDSEEIVLRIPRWDQAYCEDCGNLYHQLREEMDRNIDGILGSFHRTVVRRIKQIRDTSGASLSDRERRNRLLGMDDAP